MVPRISVGLAGAPPWGVSASDLAVGAWAWLQTRGNRASLAAAARVRGVEDAEGGNTGCGAIKSECCITTTTTSTTTII